MTTATNRNESKRLYHSPVTGEFNCGEHAPSRRSDTWWRDRWRTVTARDHAAWPVDELGPIACEVCKAIARRAAESQAGASR